MSFLKKLAGQTAIYGLSSIIGRFLNYLLVPLYTYSFPPEKYGIVTEFYAYAVVLQIILTYGMETGFFRFANKDEFDDKVVFSTILISLFSTSLLFAFSVFVFSPQIANFLGYQNHTDYIKIFAVILATDAISAIFFAKLRYEQKAVKFATFKVLNILVNIFFNLFFIVFCPKLGDKLCFFYNPNYGVGYIFISNLIASVFVILLFIPDFFSIKLKFDFSLWKKIMAYSLPLLVTGLAGSVNEMADRIMIKYFTVVPENVSDSMSYVLYQLGIYGANAKLAVFMMLFVQSFRYASEPFFFSVYKNSDFSDIFAKVMKYYIAFAFLFFLFVMLNIDIFKYFISSQYFEGLKVVFPLFLSRILVGVYFILSFWYKLNDVTKYGMFIIILGALITITFDYFFIPKFGYIAAALGNFTAYFIMVVVSYLWSRKYLKVNFDFKRIFAYVFIAISFYYFYNLIDIKVLFWKLLVGNVLILAYLVIVLRMEKISFSQIKSFLKLKL